MTLPVAYLAARYGRRDEMLGHAVVLTALKVANVQCAWLSEKHDWSGSADDLMDAQRFALDDMYDLAAADVVIVFTEAPGNIRRGGRHVEFGIALALLKRVVVIGPVENVFYALPQVERYDSFDEFVLGWRQ